MSSLSELIERVENASGKDRELDAAIACAIFKTIKTDDDLIYRVPVRKCDDCAAGTYWHVSRSGRSLHTAPLYTGSIDAALTLVPEGMGFNLQGNTNLFYAVVAGHYSKPTATPALAIVAACLKARLLDAASSEARG